MRILISIVGICAIRAGSQMGLNFFLDMVLMYLGLRLITTGLQEVAEEKNKEVK